MLTERGHSKVIERGHSKVMMLLENPYIEGKSQQGLEMVVSKEKGQKSEVEEAETSRGGGKTGFSTSGPWNS